jgi:hypothetical protein
MNTKRTIVTVDALDGILWMLWLTVVGCGGLWLAKVD